MGFSSEYKILIVLLLAIANNAIGQSKSKIDTIHIDQNDGKYGYHYLCWGSKKVDSLIASEQRKKGRTYAIQISDEEFVKLDAMQHFVYAFSNPEEFHQICTRFLEPELKLNIIPVNLPRKGGDLEMSPRQISAILGNLDSTCLLLKNCIESANGAHNIFLHAIVDYRLYELIPTLVDVFENQQQQDSYILTTICLLMKQARYYPFIKTDLYRLLYSDQKKEQAIQFADDYLPLRNDFNTNTILKLGIEFYESKQNEVDPFVRIPKGLYPLGEQNNVNNPFRFEEIAAFEISKFEVTNEEFDKFINATGFVTDAEKLKNAMVFYPGLNEFEWIKDSTANWRFPNGINRGGIEDKMNHPVTCISFTDASAYCHWAKVKLPTLDQWEIASKGEYNSRYFFGDTSSLINQYANIWQGENHFNESPNDSFQYTAPVGSFKPNPYGLYDIYGNVFEFCADNPKSNTDRNRTASARGGSWWCSSSSCNYFNSIDIGKVDINASFSNHGFRVVK